jgi:hypothetical protein
VLRYGTTRILDAGLNDIVNYIRTVGPRKFRYHLDIEIRNHRTPRTWTERLMSRPSLGRPEQMRMISSDPAACRGDRADQRLLLRPRMQYRIGDGTPVTSPSLRLFAAGKTRLFTAGKTAPPP